MQSPLKLKTALRTSLLLFAIVYGRNDLFAQENVGKILGTVWDPAGSAVPGAKVTALHLASGRRFETVSTGTGDFVLPALQIGEYSLRASAPGFKTAERSSVKVFSGVSLGVDFHLVVGEVTQTVEVTASPTRVEATSNSVAVTMESEQIST